jgi:hypothetical protein
VNAVAPAAGGSRAGSSRTSCGRRRARHGRGLVRATRCVPASSWRVLRLCGAGRGGGDQGAVHSEHGVLTKPSAGPVREKRAEVADDAVSCELRDAERRGKPAQRQVRAPVRRDQAAAGLPPTGSTVGAGGPRLLRRTAAWSPTRRRQRGLSPVSGAVQDGSDAVITPTTPGSSHQTRPTPRRSLQLRFHGTADAPQDRGKT